ncbi:MAG TPA: secretin N-terminal domain-containing protein [Opitutaceae bacterium]|nr:secretin N-terminal domain-containing protein [Opitutaceae bacterium]
MRTRSILLTSALLATAFGSQVIAQTPATPAAEPAPTAPAQSDVVVKAEEASQNVATKSKDSTGKDTLSVDFPDEDIRNILRNVADLFELNLVMPEALQGKTTIKLRDVTWRQIFQSVLTPVGYTYIEDGNIIKIVSNDSLLQEPTSTDVFILNYARASDILPTITSLVDSAAGGKIVVDARSNSLVITERPSRMNRIRPIIEQLDRATDQVMIETKFIEVTDSDVKNVGINWASLGGYNMGVLPRAQTDRTRLRESGDGFTNNITNEGLTNANNSTSTQGLQQNGTNNSGNITSTNGVPTTTLTTGTTGSSSNTVTSTISNAVANTITNTLDQLTSLTNTATDGRTLTAVFSADQFRLVLSALQTLQSTKIVSNPTVVTLNNTEATINVGEQRPLPNYAYNELRGTFEVNGFNYRDIGVNLKVTPQVNSRGFIKLNVEPEVSQSTRDAIFNGAAIPIIDVRKAKTNVSLKDGYTMGIGGLIRTSSSKQQNKVPVLGSVPGLGRFFKHDNKNIQTTNLLIFITAKSVSADGAPIEEVFDPRTLREMKIQRDELPGYRDGSDPFAVVPPPPAPVKKPLFGFTKISASNEAKK